MKWTKSGLEKSSSSDSMDRELKFLECWILLVVAIRAWPILITERCRWCLLFVIIVTVSSGSVVGRTAVVVRTGLGDVAGLRRRSVHVMPGLWTMRIHLGGGAGGRSRVGRDVCDVRVPGVPVAAVRAVAASCCCRVVAVVVRAIALRRLLSLVGRDAVVVVAPLLRPGAERWIRRCRRAVVVAGLRSVPLLEAGVVHVGQADGEGSVAHHGAAPVRAGAHRLVRIHLHHVIHGAIARFSLLDLHLLAVEVDEVIGRGAIDGSVGVELFERKKLISIKFNF